MTFCSSFWNKRSLYPHTLTCFHGTWTQWSLGRVTHVTSIEVGSKVILGSLTFWLSFWKIVTVSTYFDVGVGLILQWLPKYVIAKAGDTRGSKTALFLIWIFCISICTSAPFWSAASELRRFYNHFDLLKTVILTLFVHCTCLKVNYHCSHGQNQKLFTIDIFFSFVVSAKNIVLAGIRVSNIAVGSQMETRHFASLPFRPNTLNCYNAHPICSFL